MNFHDFLLQRNELESFSTEDVLTSCLPLLREVLRAHRAGLVAPLEGLADLQVEQSRIWFEEARRRPLRYQRRAVGQVEREHRAAVEILEEHHRTTDVGEGIKHLVRVEIGSRGQPITRPVFLPGYVAWEHELQHHDPLTDVFSLGLILASLACGLDLNQSDDLEKFVAHRRNLFVLNPSLHPVLAQTIWRMTELQRHRRAQDLAEIIGSLENYREQAVSFDVDMARLPGLTSRDPQGKSQAVLTRLRDRLFDVSRRNSLLHFHSTLGTANLTHCSIPLLLDIRNIRDDQLFVWSESLRRKLVDGEPVSLNKHLNFAEAIYLPSLLERIMSDARRDQQEYGFAQLRLVLCFLSWSNLKEKPVQSLVSPLVLLPVKLTKTKGVRDTYYLEALTSDAEINPVVRHQFRQLYGIHLPESINLAEGGLESLYEFLVQSIRASEPAVTLLRIDRPRIDLIHEKAKRRLDQYRRQSRVSGRGVRHYLNLDYSYDPANFHPLGLKLYITKVRTPSHHLRTIVETTPRPRSFVVPETGPDPEVTERERSLFQLRGAGEENPYLWNFDLCSLTLANFRYRRMSLVRDYESLLSTDVANSAFDATFSLLPRPAKGQLPAVPPLKERFDVVACDPTQATAIAEANSGESYIIQGPPGTGKSQTITNLIADFVARGKRVLFVCEKRAAIDVVYARLRQCGLSSLCCLVHDSQTDKREFVQELKQTYETLLAGAAAPSRQAEETRAALLRQLKRQLTPLETFEQQMEQEHAEAGLSGRQLLERCVELKPSISTDPEGCGEALSRLPPYRVWLGHREALASLESMIREIQPDGILARHPLRLLSPQLLDQPRPLEYVREAIPSLLQRIKAIQDRLAGLSLSPSDWSSLAHIRQLVEYAQRVHPLAHHGNLTLLEPTSQRTRQFQESLGTVRQCEAILSEARAKNEHWRERLAPADVEPALAQARQLEGRWTSLFSPRWWSLRRVLMRAYHFRAHAVQPSWVHVLTCLQQEYEAARAWEQALAAGQASLQLDGSPIETDRLLQELRPWLATLPDWLQALHGSWMRQAERGSQVVDALLAAGQLWKECEEIIRGRFAAWDRLSLAEFAETLTDLKSTIRQVPRATALLRDLRSLPDDLRRALCELPWTIPQAEAAAAAQTWRSLCDQHAELERFDGNVRRRHVEQVERLYDRWREANATAICDRVQQRFLDHVQTSSLSPSRLSPGEREFKRAYSQGRRVLEHEFGKSMRYRAIRELVDGDTGLVLRDLKPVWLMSPLSVSDALPLATDFVDVVIFDEASQIPLEEAVPSLFRGKQVIVVGDEMQLPPTDFFVTRQDELDSTMPSGAETEAAFRFDLTSDSFLNHAAKNLPSTMLGWHYRSRSESLISFSNWAFYDGRLLTVPDDRLNARTQTALNRCELLLDRPLSFHFQDAAVYDKRRNSAEAEYIAQLVRELLQQPERQSIGVIAFSEAQQEEILSALNRLAQEDDAFRGLYEEELQREVDGQFVGLLVKNLENIQGDERDIVILSICYGPGPQGKMLMNFGPINQSGGEKRLNVAFSRAKRHMAVVSSIRHAQVTNDYNEGANCLKNYLRYAEACSTGDLDGARRALASVSRWHDRDLDHAAQRDVVATQLADRLRQRGFLVEEGVGQSHFRVDLAVRQPHDTRYRLGLLVDTVAGYQQAEPLERDVMRPRLLRQFGWQIATVLAKDWYRDEAHEMERLVQLLSEPESGP